MKTPDAPKKRGAPRKPDALTAQVNVRIDADVKARADAAFTKAGTTASEVIRRVYERAAGDTEGFDRMLTSLGKGGDGGTREERERRMAAFRVLQGSLERSCREFGLSASPAVEPYRPLTDEELEDTAYRDFLKEGVA